MGYTNGDVQDKVDSEVWSSVESYGVEVELAGNISPVSPRFLTCKMGM